MITVSHVKKLNKGALVAVLTVNDDAMGIQIHECKLFEKNGKRWVQPPCKTYESNGQTKYFQFVQFLDRNKESDWAKHVWDAYQIIPQEPVNASQLAADAFDVPF